MNKKLLYFSSPWCGPCRAMAPVMQHIAKTYADKIEIEKISVDDNRELANKYQVTSIPTFILLENGEEIDRKRGMVSPISMQTFLRL